MSPRSTPDELAVSPLPADAGIDRVVHIGKLEGTLTVPPWPVGLVLFAQAGGSHRLRVRNHEVVRTFHIHRLGTLLLDLLAPDEAGGPTPAGDIPLLGSRLIHVIDWLGEWPRLSPLPIGLFGADSVAAAALVAAARRPDVVAAVVSRGGRPDLALDDLADVRAATLLIVGAEDREVLRLNRLGAQALRCERQIEIIPRATHLFEEAGALERVAVLAANWFETRLAAARRPPAD